MLIVLLQAPSVSLLASGHQPTGKVSGLVTSWSRMILDLAKLPFSYSLYFLSEFCIFPSSRYFPPELLLLLIQVILLLTCFLLFLPCRTDTVSQSQIFQ